MCGIIAGRLLNGNFESKYKKIIKKIYLESMIRGKHSSGVSFYDGEKINLKVIPESSDKLVVNRDFLSLLNEILMKPFVGHVRYSTSDINYNQPIKINNKFSIVHNGVITQREFEHWKDDYKELLTNYKLKTKNDTESSLFSMSRASIIFTPLFLVLNSLFPIPNPYFLSAPNRKK